MNAVEDVPKDQSIGNWMANARSSGIFGESGAFGEYKDRADKKINSSFFECI